MSEDKATRWRYMSREQCEHLMSAVAAIQIGLDKRDDDVPGRSVTPGARRLSRPTGPPQQILQVRPGVLGQTIENIGHGDTRLLAAWRSGSWWKIPEFSSVDMLANQPGHQQPGASRQAAPAKEP